MLENTKGLSDKQLNEIQSKLEHLASSLKGEVMVFELVQYVQVIYSFVINFSMICNYIYFHV